MEIEITSFFAETFPRDYSASVAEIGQNAGAVTWRAACEDSEEYMLLDSEEKREAARAFFASFGAWDDADIAAWSDEEVNTLLLQFIAGDMRDMESLGHGRGAVAWEEYEKGARAGTFSGRLFRSDAGAVYYDIGD